MKEYIYEIRLTEDEVKQYPDFKCDIYTKHRYTVDLRRTVDTKLIRIENKII